MKRKKLTSGNSSAIVMGVIYVALMVFMLPRINSQTQATWIFHIATEFFCLTSILVIFVWHLKDEAHAGSKKRRFAELCAILFVALATDIVAWLVDGRKEYYWLEYGTNFLLYLLMFVHGAKFVLFSFSLVKEETPELLAVRKNIMRILNIQFVARLIILLCGGYFYMNEEGFSVSGPMAAIGYEAISLMVLFVCGAVSATGLPKRKILQIMSYPLAILGMLLLGLLDENYANGLVGVTLSMIFIYFSMTLDAGEGKESLDKNFKRYLDDDVVEHLTSGTEALRPGGSTQYVTMVFCQLHRFGKITESMEPEKVVDILNTFYSEMLEVVSAYSGTLLEFPGYGIFCIFGAYEESGDHANRAVTAAKKMQKSMEIINARNRKKGYPEIAIGIGINTGDVVLGNVGSKNHMRFTAISSNVNLASRVETYAADGDILVTQTTLEESTNILEFEKVCTVIPKGISRPIDVFRIKTIQE